MVFGGEEGGFFEVGGSFDSDRVRGGNWWGGCSEYSWGYNGGVGNSGCYSVEVVFLFDVGRI